MNISGFGSGDNSRWSMSDSANSYVQYQMANSQSGGNSKPQRSGTSSGSDASAVFWGLYVISAITAFSSGIPLGLALLLSLPVAAVLGVVILLIATAIAALFKRK